MFSHSESVDAGTVLRSLLTDGEYVVVNNYDPANLRHNATITIAPVGHMDQAFDIGADRIEQDFHTVERGSHESS